MLIKLEKLKKINIETNRLFYATEGKKVRKQIKILHYEEFYTLYCNSLSQVMHMYVQCIDIFTVSS